MIDILECHYCHKLLELKSDMVIAWLMRIFDSRQVPFMTASEPSRAIVKCPHCGATSTCSFSQTAKLNNQNI